MEIAKTSHGPSNSSSLTGSRAKKLVAVNGNLASHCIAVDLADSPFQLLVTPFKRGKPSLAGVTL